MAEIIEASEGDIKTFRRSIGSTRKKGWTRRVYEAVSTTPTDPTADGDTVEMPTRSGGKMRARKDGNEVLAAVAAILARTFEGPDGTERLRAYVREMHAQGINTNLSEEEAMRHTMEWCVERMRPIVEQTWRKHGWHKPYLLDTHEGV